MLSDGQRKMKRINMSWSYIARFSKAIAISFITIFLLSACAKTNKMVINSGNDEKNQNQNSDNNQSSLLEGMDEPVPEAEQEYIDTVLSQISTKSNKDEVLSLLGKPDRDLGLKINWWVTIDGNNNRVGVYFDSLDGHPNRIVLDGGPGRFYYVNDLD